MAKWCNDNPCEIYADYRDELPQKMAQLILDGKFDDFWESAYEREFEITDYPEFWFFWESEFASEFGYDSFSEMPEFVKEIAYENRMTDSRDFWRTCARNTRVHVNVILHKRNGELVYGPNLWQWDSEEYERARYIARAFGFDKAPRAVAESLELVYGGYDMECAVIFGTVDLWEILESGKKPEFVTVNQDDSDNLLFYDFSNGAGNMGTLKIGKERKFRASFHIDGTRGYGIDSCYGFCGSVWSHELKVS